MTTLRSFSRQFRNGLSRTLWRWTKPLRQPPREVAALDPIIANTRKAHGPVRRIEREKMEIAHRLLREGLHQ